MAKLPNQGSALLDDVKSPHRVPAAASPAAAAPEASPPGSGGTFISGDTVIEGKILAQSELCIDGTFKGDIISNSRVIVGTAGRIEGSVEAKSLVLSGKVIGNLNIHERAELLSTGEVFGDLQIKPGALITEKGAQIEGRILMGISESKSKSAPKGGGGAPAEKPAAEPSDDREKQESS